MSNIENVNKEELASFKPTLSRTMSVNVHEDEYTLSKPVMTWAYTLDTGACNDPLNGGEPSELEKIADKKRALHIDDLQIDEEEEEDEEEEGIGCNECYACVTGGGKPCLKETNIEREP
jgi:hypothetical protein